MNPSRRALLGAGFLVCAPAIVRAQNLMPIHSPWLTMEEFLERTTLGGYLVSFSWQGLVTRTNRSIPLSPEEMIGYGKPFPHLSPNPSYPEYRWREGIRL